MALTPGLAQAAREAADKALALVPGLPEGRLARGQYFALIEKDPKCALEDCRPEPATGANTSLECAAQAETTLGNYDQALAHLNEARTLAPRSGAIAYRRAQMLLWTRRYADAIEAADEAIRLDPGDVAALETKSMGFLGLGDLAAARRAIAGRPPEMEAADIVMNFGLDGDLMWVLDAELQSLLFSLPAEAFGGDAASRALVFAQTHALNGNMSEARASPTKPSGDSPSRAARISETSNWWSPTPSPSPTWAGGTRRFAKDSGRSTWCLPRVTLYAAQYSRHQVVRILMVLGEREMAIDLLEPLLSTLYYLSPAWLAIDPNFAPLKGHPRFENLLRAGR